MSEDASASFDMISPESLRRRGTAKWNAYGPDVIAAWVAEMDFPTASPVMAAIHDAVEREEFGYAQGDAATGLPDAVADWCGSRGWVVDPARVHVLPYALRGVELAIECYSPPGSAILVPTPAYEPFFEIPQVLGRPIMEVPLARRDADYVLDLDAIGAALSRGARTLILCHPHNPTGRSFTRAELQGLASVVAHYDARVVSDEVHGPLTYSGVHVPYASVNDEAAAHTLTVTSASKAWNLAGLKCAQLITSNDIDEDRWAQIPTRKTKGASTIGIRANIAAFRSGGPWLAQTMAYLDVNRRLIRELLSKWMPAVGYQPPEATYFAWLDCRRLNLGVEPAAFFLDRARVAMSPGTPFGNQTKDFVRFNFATSRSRVEAAIDAMTAALDAR